jgi:hypothetical protein
MDKRIPLIKKIKPKMMNPVGVEQFFSVDVWIDRFILIKMTG